MNDNKRDNYKIEHFSHDVWDEKKRAVGIRLSTWRDGEGYAWRLHPTRDGDPFGALRKEHVADTEKERHKRAMSAIALARKRSQRKFGGNPE